MLTRHRGKDQYYRGKDSVFIPQYVVTSGMATEPEQLAGDYEKAARRLRSDQRRGEAPFLWDIEPLSDSRTELADFFHSLLQAIGRQRGKPVKSHGCITAGIRTGA